MREFSIAAIPADGIGPEVIEAGVTVLDALQKRMGDEKFNVPHFDWGSDYYKKHGVMMPADGLETLRPFDAIYFGAVGAPTFPITSRWGVSACRSARALTSTPMCGPPRSCPASPRRCWAAGPRTWTG